MKLELKQPPPLKSVDTLPREKWSTIQIYRTVNLVQSDKKRLITVNVHKGYIVCFSTRINSRHVFKMSTFGTCIF